MAEWSAEITVAPELARGLIREQFGELATTRLQLLGTGWDNTAYLVDDTWVFRFPRRAAAVPGIEREIAVLRRLTGLPVAIPVPRFIGTGSSRYPWPFVGSRYIDGRELTDTTLSDAQRETVGTALGSVLRSLHHPSRVEPLADVLPADPLGRSDMRQRVKLTRDRLADIVRLGLWAIPSSLTAVLRAAADLPPALPTVVAHGDLHVRQLLIGVEGSLTGVIDWGDICRADPSIDLSLYWSLLSPAGREALRGAYGPVSEEQLLRARVLSIFLNALLAAYAHAEGFHTLERQALLGLHRITVD